MVSQPKLGRKRGQRAVSECLPIAEAAEAVGVLSMQVYGWVRNKKLRYRQVKGQGHGGIVFLVALDDVRPLAEAYLEKRAKAAAAKPDTRRTADGDRISYRISYRICPCVLVARTPGWELTALDRAELERRRELFNARRAS